MSSFLLVAAMALALQDSASLAEPEVQAVVEPDSLTIGDPFTLTLSVSGVSAGHVRFPQFPDTGIIIASGPPQEIGDQAGGPRLAVYELTAWRVGELLLPAAEIIIEQGGVERAIPLPGVSVRVTSVLPAEADPDTLALKPALGVLGGNWSTAEKLAGAGLALAVLLALSVYLRRRNAAAQVMPRPPAKPPRQRALEALEALAASGLIEVGEYRGFYSVLAMILRVFIAESYPAWGLDMTSSELLAVAMSDGMDEGAREALRRLLGEADLVKFARHRAPAERAIEALEVTRGWVIEFEPPELEEPEPEEATVLFETAEDEVVYGDSEAGELEAFLGLDRQVDPVDGDEQEETKDGEGD